MAEYSKHKGNAFPGSGRLRPQDEEVRQLKRRITDLEEENAILKKQRRFYRKTPEAKYQFIDQYRDQNFGWRRCARFWMFHEAVTMLS